jgi:DNA-binding transcriptional regulator YbjK
VLRCTLVLISERGVEAVTHRAAADAADVPLGSVTYYFESKEQMLREALELWVREEVERLEELASALQGATMTPAEAAQAFQALLEVNDPHAIAQMDLYLYAARVPELRESAENAFAAYERVSVAALTALGNEDPERAAPLFVALADGLGLRRLATGSAPALADSLVALFEAFASSDRRSPR